MKVISIENEIRKWEKMTNKYLSRHNLDHNEYHQTIEDLKEEWLFADIENRKEIEMDIIDYCENMGW